MYGNTDPDLCYLLLNKEGKKAYLSLKNCGGEAVGSSFFICVSIL